MQKRAFNQSLHFKLILTYITLISIIGIISVGFVYIFANSYLILQTKQELAESGEAFAREAGKLNWADDTTITDLQIIFRENIDSSVSLVLADSNFEYIADTGMNVDHLRSSPEAFVRYLSRYRDSLGARILPYGGATYAVTIQQVYNVSTQRVLGYVILFTAPTSTGIHRSLLTSGGKPPI